MWSRLSKYTKVARRWWLRRSPATRALPYYIWRAIANFSQNGTERAASLAYFSLLSVFPLTLLFAVIISSLLGPAVAQEQITSALDLFLPPDTISLLQTNVQDALQQGTSFGIAALGVLIWTGSTLFSNITRSLEAIFQVPVRRSMWRQRLLAILMAIVLVMLVMASFITSGILRLVAALLAAAGPPSIWITIGSIFLPFGLDIVIFALLFRYVPTRYVRWDAVWTASLVGAVGWELARKGFDWFLTNLANFQFVYGGIATVIVLMLWAYLMASIFIFSAELCAQLNRWLHLQEHLPDDDRPGLLYSPRIPDLPRDTTDRMELMDAEDFFENDFYREKDPT